MQGGGGGGGGSASRSMEAECAFVGGGALALGWGSVICGVMNEESPPPLSMVDDSLLQGT